MAYITRLSHFTFHKYGDELVITSERDDSFEQRHDWPSDWTMTDEDLAKRLHEEYYLELQDTYES